MSSPHLEGAELSDTKTGVKSQKTGSRRRRAQQSPFKVSDDNIFLLNANEREAQKEELHKFLALPIEEKTTHAARMMAKLKNELVGELEVENERKKILKQVRSETVLPKQTLSTHEPNFATMKRENMTRERKQDLIFMERQKAVLELSLMSKRSEMMKMDKVVAKEERKLKQLESTIEQDNQRLEEFLKENERKSVEARTLFEREDKLKQEKNIEIKKLAAEIGTIRSEISKFEEILIDYKRYEEFLFKISPPEWQHEHKNKTSKAKVVSEKDGRVDQNEEPQEMAARTGLESKPSSSETDLSSIGETGLSSAQSDTLRKTSEVDVDSSEADAELYFTDPQQLLNLMTELTEQNLSLIQNSARVEEVLEELRRSTETTRRNIEGEEEQIVLQRNELKQRIHKEEERGSALQQMIQLHVSLSTEERDVMLEALGEKVGEVHCSCVGDRMTNLSTLEKMADIENLLYSVLQSLESIPEVKLQRIKKIKDSEKRSRQREEKQREQSEKQKERMRRVGENSCPDVCLFLKESKSSMRTNPPLRTISISTFLSQTTWSKQKKRTGEIILM
ncbi:cilia- and flagella-associated protein 100-like isoform X2 [Kryptolebias marmoratus]|uniref:cilia- and flagella-associated protein 100-like isoform X2 n=1 Tax=Kryptolebias marmoratus TaxID=37003 RepID=UPI000D530ED9|nr:cilia- and flagella-associated protein 100-like isoform X2 [Kryptolebias marmoratus]